jgi:V8-like Glu-specific endopeptidase
MNSIKSNIDNRENLYSLEYAFNRNLPSFSKLAKQARSIACLVHQLHLNKINDSSWKLNKKYTDSLSTYLKDIIKNPRPGRKIKTSKLRFKKEPALGFGTGFLVGLKDNTLNTKYFVTAAHCLCDKNKQLDPNEIKKTRVVFDFYVNGRGTCNEVFKDVYEIKKVVNFKYDSKADWALVKLSKKVPDRPPLKMADDSLCKLKDPVYMLGYPNGLPIKVTHSGNITYQNPDSIETNLPSFEGSSGSPLFNIDGKVLGLHVSGYKNDYFIDSKTDELLPNLSKKELYGAEAQRIKPIKDILKRKKLVSSQDVRT